jgi:hypothetical protein
MAVLVDVDDHSCPLPPGALVGHQVSVAQGVARHGQLAAGADHLGNALAEEGAGSAEEQDSHTRVGYERAGPSQAAGPGQLGDRQGGRPGGRCPEDRGRAVLAGPSEQQRGGRHRPCGDGEPTLRWRRPAEQRPDPHHGDCDDRDRGHHPAVVTGRDLDCLAPHRVDQHRENRAHQDHQHQDQEGDGGGGQGGALPIALRGRRRLRLPDGGAHHQDHGGADHDQDDRQQAPSDRRGLGKGVHRLGGARAADRGADQA